MIRQPSSWKAYIHIRRSRFRKKYKLIKMALQMMIDKTIAIYLVILLGYAVSAFFIFADLATTYQSELQFFETEAEARFWLILTVIPLRYLFQAFRLPSVFITSSDYQLGLLPYSIRRIWMYVAAEKWVKKIVIYGVLVPVMVWVTGIAAKILLLYAVLFIVTDILMTVPQWKLYGQKWYVKSGWLFVGLLFNGIGLYFSITIEVGIFIFAILLVWNGLLIPHIFKHVNWPRITEISDYHTWKMPFIERASETKYKRSRRFGMFSQSKRKKYPFHYDNHSIYSRMWQLYFRNNLEHAFKLVGALLVMLVMVRLFWTAFAMFIAIALALHIFFVTAGTFFRDRFRTDLLEVLPWDLFTYKQAYMRWMLIGSVPLVLTIFFHFVFHFTWWAPFQLLFIAVIAIFIANQRLDASIAVISKSNTTSLGKEMASYILLGIFIVSYFYPFLSLLAPIILVIQLRKLRENRMEIPIEHIQM